MKDIIKQKAKYLQEYTETFNKVAIKAKNELMTTHKESYAKDKASLDIEEITRDTLYIQGFYQADIRELQNELVNVYNFAMLVEPEIELDEETKGLVMLLKQSIPSRIFTVENGELNESEKGRVKKLFKDYEEKNYFKLFEKHVSLLLDA